MSNLQVEANQSINNIPITLTPKQQPTLLLTPDKVWGTKDYENLENKPSLNGRELTKGMTLADFNLYPDKVEKNEEDIININEYLKELTPKNTAEGESSLHIKDALELPIFEMSIEGNSYQQQTTGKQLYNVYDTVTVSEKATVDSDGWITISETNTTHPVIYHNYYTNNLNLVGGKEYAIILEVKEVGGTGRIILTSNHTYEDGTRVAGQFEDSIYLGFSSLASNSKKVFLKTTIEDPTQVMNGLRTYLEFQNGNSGSITFRISVLEDTSITPETFEYEPYTGEIPGPNPNYPQEIEVIENEIKYKLINKNLVDFSKYYTKSDVITTFDFTNDVLTFGSTVESAHPVVNYDITDIFKKNIGKYVSFDFEYAEQTNAEAVPYIQLVMSYKNGLQDKFIGLVGDKFNTKTPGQLLLRDRVGNPVDLDDIRLVRLQLVLNNQLTKKANTITIKKPIFYFGTERLLVGDVFNYIPHESNEILVNLQGNFMAKNGDIADISRVENGRAILIKKINKIILDSNDGWYKSSIASIDRYGIPLSTLNITNFEGMQMLCNYFKYTTNQVVMKGTFKIINNHLYIDFSEYGTSTLDNFKTWLSENPVIVYYTLATPYEVDLGEVDMPKTFKDTSNVQVITNVNQNNINLTYALDLKKYYDNKIAELSNQLL